MGSGERGGGRGRRACVSVWSERVRGACRTALLCCRWPGVQGTQFRQPLPTPRALAEGRWPAASTPSPPAACTHLAGGPVVEGNEVLAPHPQQLPAVDGVSREGGADGQRFLEVAVDLDCNGEEERGAGGRVGAREAGWRAAKKQTGNVGSGGGRRGRGGSGVGLGSAWTPGCGSGRSAAHALVLLLSRVANTFESSPHTNSRAWPKLCGRGGVEGRGVGCRSWPARYSSCTNDHPPPPTPNNTHLVAPRKRCVDDILAVAAHRHKAAVGGVLQGLGVNVRGAQVLDSQRQPLAVGLRRFWKGQGRRG